VFKYGESADRSRGRVRREADVRRPMVAHGDVPTAQAIPAKIKAMTATTACRG
jgi:hypothetical protein